MRIIQIYTEFLPSIGGIQLNIYNIAKRLVDKGHEVIVLTTNMVGGSPAKLPSEEVINGVRVLRLRVIPTGLSYRLALAPSIISKLFSVDVELFHVFSFLPYFLTNIACVISRLRKIPLIMTPTYHPNRYLVYTGLTGRLVKALYDDFIGLKLLKKADFVIALTEGEAQYYRKNGIENVHVIPVGVHLKEQTCTADGVEELRGKFNLNGKVILHVGRLEKRKGIHFLIKAMPHVLKNFAKAKLLIVGADWGYQSQLRDLTRNLGIEKNVVFAGYLSFLELSCAYELADVVVIPSVFEAFSHIVIEAWSHKKPIIAAKTIGLAERISVETGILFSLGDYKSLAYAITRILSNRELAKLIGMNGYYIVKKEFTWNKIVNDLENVYQLLTIEKKQHV